MRQDIFVTNHNDFHHSDMYDGVEYEFPPKERVIVSVDAATHMFGFNMPDKSGVLARLGWAWKVGPNGKFVEDPDGVKKLAHFAFTKGVMIEAPVDAPDPEPVGLAPGGEHDLPRVGRKPKGAVEFLSDSRPLV